MFVRVKEKSNGKKSIQIVETYRRGDKVHQKIVRHIGQGRRKKKVDVLKRLAQSILVAATCRFMLDHEKLDVYKISIKQGKAVLTRIVSMLTKLCQTR